MHRHDPLATNARAISGLATNAGEKRGPAACGKTPRRTESGEARGWQGAKSEHIRPYVSDEQRSPAAMHRRSNAAGFCHRLLAGRARNLAYVGVWTVAFILLSAAGGVGDTHRGTEVTFWQQACADDLPNGCRQYAVLVSGFCNNGSGWACNEYGILLQPERRPEQAARAFRRGCDSGFEAACANLDSLGPDGPLRAAPALADYEIVVRAGRRPLPPDLPPLQLYQRACEQGFADGCRRACELGDESACAAATAVERESRAP